MEKRCARIFCQNPATTIVIVNDSEYRGRVWCDECVRGEKQRQALPGDMFRLTFEPIPAPPGAFAAAEE